MTFVQRHGDAFVVLTEPTPKRRVSPGDSLAHTYADRAHAIIGSMRGGAYLFGVFVPEDRRGRGEARRLLANLRVFMAERAIPLMRAVDASDGLWTHFSRTDAGITSAGYGMSMVIHAEAPRPDEARSEERRAQEPKEPKPDLAAGRFQPSR